MTEDGSLPAPTLGERLDAHGRRHAERLLVPLSWAGMLRVFMDRAAGLTAGAGRFERFESTPDRPAPLTTTALPGRLRTARDPGPYAADDPAPDAPAPEGRPGPAPAAVGPSSTAPTPPSPSPGARPPGAARRHEDGASASTGRRQDDLPATARSRLRAVVGPAAEAMRVHDDERADSLARARRADAVTVGQDVYFRHGRLRPRDERGFALLVHEATHVMALLRPGASWRRATGAGVRAEEAEAMAGERSAWSGAGSPRRPSGPGLPARPHPARPTAHPSGAAHGPPAASPADPATPPAMRAPADRDAPTATTADAGPPIDLNALKRELVDDLMRQLRNEFERGG
ncbi:DUF4157 domain-containing protein [Streptomyces scabiei]|uniref:eCIS core domain-containing protein n=1 Tax=Streptomyces scabiei TaxID=1930 RepID=UPI0029AE1D3C|nr:DUF4157 domain-containing protein [Streptomyces scabiei]MDX3117087.1 DUF4157 domain-containing protein [Streptomyces scabiei]